MFSTILKNTLYLSSSQVLNSLLYLLLAILTARYLGAEGLGSYAFIFTLGESVFILGNFGLDQLSVRTLSVKKKMKNELFSNLFMLRLFLGLISMAILITLTKLLIYAQLVEKDLALPTYLIGLAFLISLQILNLNSYFEAFQKMVYESYINIIKSLVHVFLAVIFLIMGKGILHLVIAFSIGNIVAFLIGLVILLKKITRINLNINLPLCVHFIKTGSSFLMIKIFGSIIYRTDIIVLKIICGSKMAGLYSAADNIIKNLFFMMNTFSTAVYPQMSILFKKSKNKAIDFYKKSRNILLGLSVIIFSLTSLFAKPIILLVYGYDFYDSILVLRLLSIVGVLAALTCLNNAYLFSIHQQKTVFWLKMFVCILCIVLNIIFVLKYGLFGTVIAMIINAITYFIATAYTILSYNKD
jgi:O-antigen/teichoic acid export membrane protein